MRKRTEHGLSWLTAISDAGSTPAASTTNSFIFNSLQTKSAGKAKKNATHKLFRIKQIQISTRHFEEPPPGKATNIFVVRENIRIKGFGGSKCEPKFELKTWCLRIIYGSEHLLPENLELLRSNVSCAKNRRVGLTSAPSAFWHWRASSSIRACEAGIFQRNVGKNGGP